MTNGFIYLKGNCPICVGVRKDCRQNQSTNLYHCRDANANPLNYIERGLDAHGFIMWAEGADSEKFLEEKNSEYREQRLREQSARKIALLKEQEDIRAASLSEKDRHREYEKLLAQLTLSIEHREKLHTRGLTDSEIKAASYRSVTQWQKLTTPINDRLAGIRQGGCSMLTSSSGILCPIKNVNGYWVGSQIKCDKDGSYRWLNGDKNINPRPTSHLPNGELPLAVYKQDNNVDVVAQRVGIVGLAEGTSFKPYLTHLRLNIPIVGASGGNWASSASTFKETLLALKAKVVRLFPDAGSLSNKGILTAYQKTIELATEWGYQVEIAWWGQVLKSDGDIDEINTDTLALIQYLTPDEFFQKSTDLQTISNLPHELPRRLFTADTKYHSEFLPKVEFEDGHAYAIKSPLGSGKTQLLKDFLEKNQEKIVANQTQVINIGTRNTLQKQFISEVNRELDPLIHKGFIHVNDKDNIDIEKDPWISLCYDSLLKVESNKVDKAIIILDELISGWGHLYFAKTHISGQRYEIIQNFVKILKGAELIICLDANLADWATDHLSKLINKPITKIENTYQTQQKYPYQFLLGTSFDEKESIHKNDKRPRIKDIIRLATEIIKIKKLFKRAKNKDEVIKLQSQLPRMVIPTDSQAMAEKLHIWLQSMGLNVYRLDRKTSGLKASQEFLANPNIYLETYQIDVFIYTPSGESGLNISIKDYFKYRFCFFFGVFDVNPVDSVTQMVKRVRDDIITKIWVSEKAINNSTKNSTTQADQLKKELSTEFNLKISIILAAQTLGNELKIQLIQQYQESQDIHYNFAMCNSLQY